MQRANDLLCFSHLRWNFVFQRPNHLMCRAAAKRRVLYIEEPIYGAAQAHVTTTEARPNLLVVTPHLPQGMNLVGELAAHRALLDRVYRQLDVNEPLVWLYTPMALELTEGLSPAAVVYDCMDELSGFHGAPAALQLLEAKLLARADLVFTGGASLCRAKRRRRRDAHLFPSSVELEHFRAARLGVEEPADQRDLPGPRIGFFGVIDERTDLELLADVARRRPDWSLVMVGPVVKIDPASLPRLPNIQYLGQKTYAELPSYLAGWDVAMMPFAMNDATRFISPTKTLEYLAGGKPVVSTPIADVVSPYGEQGLVAIARDADEFVAGTQKLLAGERPTLEAVDAFLARGSWDRTWDAMATLIEDTVAKRRRGRQVHTHAIGADDRATSSTAVGFDGGR
jgi:UDP-galactopyranose mutase